MSECPCTLSEETKAKISKTITQQWRERLNRKRAGEKFISIWGESIAKVAKKGGHGQKELEWDSYEKIEREIVLQQLKRSADVVKAKEMAPIRAERRAKAKAEKVKLTLKKQVAKVNGLGKKKSKEEKEELAKSEDLKLKERLTKIDYEKWDSMIEKVKIEIYKKEKRLTSERSLFYDVVHRILVDRWAKNNTPLHCLAHSLNPRYYSDTWLLEDSTRSAPHRDGEISQERMKCFRRLFPNDDEYARILDEYAMFSMKNGPFGDLTSISMMATMEPKNWWLNFGAQTPFLQTLAFRLLGQPTSSSCAERNWSTYAFIHSLKRNKLTTSRAEDLVYIHNNLRLLSRNPIPNDDVKMWDVGGDAFDSMEDAGFLEFADLSLDEPDFENDLISDN